MEPKNMNTEFEPKPLLMKNKIQNYAWGERGKDAFIPNFLGESGEENKPYAELWMGVHPNAPSEVIYNDSTMSLPELIDKYAAKILGKSVAEKFDNTLPFLLKVLSAGEALSIQAHPNKQQAEFLHAKDPEHYPDDNHKPEIAISLDSLTALVGFKSIRELISTLNEYPEIADFIGKGIIQKLNAALNSTKEILKETLRFMYANLMNRSMTHTDELKFATQSLAERLIGLNRELTEQEQLFLELKEKYGDTDVGLFSLFILNLMHLKPGQGVFLKAGIPHAYLKGNIIECMANSDNVVRAGLTPKFKDVQTLVDILTYESDSISVLGENSTLKEIVYRTPVSEFQISRIQIGTDERINKNTNDKLEILLITKGEIHFKWDSKNTEFKKGHTILIPASLLEYKVEAKSDSEIFRVTIP